MTNPGADWQETFDAAHRVPGPTKQHPGRKTPEDLMQAAQFARERYSADVAVALGAVDTGDDFDAWSWLADYAADYFATKTGLASTQDGIVEQVLPGSGGGPSGVSQAMAALSQTVLGLSQDVQTLQHVGGTGKTYVINFADYPDGEQVSIGVPFDMTYTGTGTGYQEVLNGISRWHKVVDGDRSVIGRYDDGVNTDTDTDYQWLQATAAGPMDVGAEEAFCARMNPAKTSYVYIKGYRPSTYAFKCELGCYVGGVKTVFVTDVNATFSLNLSMKAGVDGNPYHFQVFSGKTLIIDYPDVDEVSEVGAGFRGWGFFASTFNGGNAIPAAATRVQCSDNNS